MRPDETDETNTIVKDIVQPTVQEMSEKIQQLNLKMDQMSVSEKKLAIARQRTEQGMEHNYNFKIDSGDVNSPITISNRLYLNFQRDNFNVKNV